MPDVDHYVAEHYEKRRKRRRYILFGGLFGIFYLIAVLAVWILFWTPFFRYRTIEVLGNSNVSRPQVIDVLFASLGRKSSWDYALGARSLLVWPKELSGDDLKLLPEIKQLTVQKDYRGRRLLISVVERAPFGLWCLKQGSGKPADATSSDVVDAPPQATSCWWFDEEGTMFKHSSFEGEGNLIKVVHDYSGRTLALGSVALAPELMPNLISVFRVIDASGIGVREVRLQSLDVQEIHVRTYAGPELYFSLRFPVDSDLTVLQSLKTKPEFSKLQYVDFRVENRAYYK